MYWIVVKHWTQNESCHFHGLVDCDPSSKSPGVGKNKLFLHKVAGVNAQ